MSGAGAGRKMVVFGGTGFIGSHIVKLAHANGWNVIAASRSGEPTIPEPWTKDVAHVSIDALVRPDVYQFLDEHPDTHTVISCIGKLTYNKREARRINGDATCNVAAAAVERKSIEKVAFISAADMQPVNKIFSAYYYGKRQGEKAMKENLGDRHIIMRPGMVYGTRSCYNIPLPLGVIGKPLELLFNPLQQVCPLTILTPPISVDNLAKATLEACSEEKVSGTFEYHSMMNLARRF